MLEDMNRNDKFRKARQGGGGGGSPRGGVATGPVFVEVRKLAEKMPQTRSNEEGYWLIMGKLFFVYPTCLGLCTLRAGPEYGAGDSRGRLIALKSKG